MPANLAQANVKYIAAQYGVIVWQLITAILLILDAIERCFDKFLLREDIYFSSPQFSGIACARFTAIKMSASCRQSDFSMAWVAINLLWCFAISFGRSKPNFESLTFRRRDKARKCSVFGEPISDVVLTILGAQSTTS